MANVTTLAGVRCLLLPDSGEPLVEAGDFLDLIGDAWAEEAQMLVLPVSRLTDAFFDLSTRLAGEVLQKMVNYHLRVAVVGDIEGYVMQSHALGDFVYESNLGRSILFVPDLDTLQKRLAEL